MREIKFRAWDKERMEMLLPDRLVHLEGRTTKALREQSPFLELMQFTGLCDKNGREIYEGDIVVTGGDISGVVIYNEGGFCFDTIDDFDCDFICNYTVEVIGNIHENPELMDGEK